MFAVALIGPDGSGKTTIAKHLEAHLMLPVKYLYMGVSLDSSTTMLFTSRLIRRIKRALGTRPDTTGPRDPRQTAASPKGMFKRCARELKSLLSLMNRIGDEWYRQFLAWYYQRRGYVVLFDRHYFPDYHAYDVAPRRGRSLSSRLHGWMLQNLYPKPTLVIYLDAPGEVLYARKGEGTVELLERRRRDYLELQRVVEHFALVDASRPEDVVAAEVARLICDFYEARFGKSVPGHARG